MGGFSVSNVSFSQVQSLNDRGGRREVVSKSTFKQAIDEISRCQSEYLSARQSGNITLEHGKKMLEVMIDALIQTKKIIQEGPSWKGEFDPQIFTDEGVRGSLEYLVGMNNQLADISLKRSNNTDVKNTLSDTWKNRIIIDSLASHFSSMSIGLNDYLGLTRKILFVLFKVSELQSKIQNLAKEGGAAKLLSDGVSKNFGSFLTDISELFPGFLDLEKKVLFDKVDGSRISSNERFVLASLLFSTKCINAHAKSLENQTDDIDVLHSLHDFFDAFALLKNGLPAEVETYLTEMNQKQDVSKNQGIKNDFDLSEFLNIEDEINATDLFSLLGAFGGQRDQRVSRQVKKTEVERILEASYLTAVGVYLNKTEAYGGHCLPIFEHELKQALKAIHRIDVLVNKVSANQKQALLHKKEQIQSMLQSFPKNDQGEWSAEIFELDLLKRQIRPYPNGLVSLMERHELELSEVKWLQIDDGSEFSVPTDMLEIGFQPKRNSKNEVMDPVWLHIHVQEGIQKSPNSKFSNLAAYLKDTAFTDLVTAMHLKTNSQRGLGKQWEEAQHKEKSAINEAKKVLRVPVDNNFLASLSLHFPELPFPNKAGSKTVGASNAAQARKKTGKTARKKR